MALNPTTLIRSRSSFFGNPALPTVTGRVGGLPAAQAKGIFPLDDPNPARSVTNYATQAQSAPIIGSGGAVYSMTGGGAAIAGRAAIPQEAASAADLTQPWTAFAGVLLQAASGAAVWPILGDVAYSSGGHGFQIFAQSGGALANGSQLPIFVRMSKNGADDSSSQIQLPAQANLVVGRGFLLVVSYDGNGKIKAQGWTSNGKVSEIIWPVNITDGLGPTNAKTNASAWRGAGADYATPGTLMEAWGVVQTQWSDADAFAAYRMMRKRANANGRNWT